MSGKASLHWEKYICQTIIMPFSKILTERFFVMEKDLLFKMVQGQIGYAFKNLDLLNQAFTRRSWTEENGGENNEILEFIGDKALDLAVVKFLAGKFGNLKANAFSCSRDEGELTTLKSRMVEKRTLAARIDELGFSEGLIMGNSDIKNHVAEEMSVKEDLFEAILGAVALDCAWDLSVIESVVEAMLVPEDFLLASDDNYVRMIHDWEQQENHVIPLFKFKKQSYSSTWYVPFDGISQTFPIGYNHINLKFVCEMKLLDNLPIFRGFGVSKSEARMSVCKLAYDYLCDKGYIQEMTIRDEIDEPTKEAAINQLEILARRGYFSIPTYEFTESYDADGNPIWSCECSIAEYKERFSAKSSSKKDAKKSAALKMLIRVLEED